MCKTYLKLRSALKSLTSILHCKTHPYGNNVAMVYKNARIYSHLRRNVLRYLH